MPACASYPTFKEQRESETLHSSPERPWVAPGRVSLMECTDTASAHTLPALWVRAPSPLVKWWMLLSTLLTFLQSCKTRLALVSARKLKAGKEWSSPVFSFAPSSSNTPALPFLLAALLCENECNLSLASYTNIFKCCLWSFTGNIILAQLDTVMRTNDVCLI